MKALDRHPEVVGLARSLGIRPGEGVAQAIVTCCRQMVERMIHEAVGVDSIQAVQQLISERLGLVFEEFRSDRELAEIVRRHVAAGDVVFASLPALFDAATYATLIRTKPALEAERIRYVAAIDCRGGKAHRRWFTRWHEIAHLLVLNGRELAEPVQRSTTAPSATERLMDWIASEVGFLDALFCPLLEAELSANQGLTFAGVQRIREHYCPEASFQSTLLACLRRLPQPAVYLEAGLGRTKSEEEAFDSEPVPARRPQPKLRVLVAVPNDAARAVGFGFHRNQEVPGESVLHRLFFDANGAGLKEEETGSEAAGIWHLSSKGSRFRMMGRVQKHMVAGIALHIVDRNPAGEAGSTGCKETQETTHDMAADAGAGLRRAHLVRSGGITGLFESVREFHAVGGKVGG